MYGFIDTTVLREIFGEGIVSAKWKFGVLTLTIACRQSGDSLTICGASFKAMWLIFQHKINKRLLLTYP